ncbi:DUF7739 domain-containing protein [Streptomyces sp. SGAir0957]
MSDHVVLTTSHGSDFFGVDTYSTQALRDLATHLPWALNAEEHRPLTDLLEHAGSSEQIIEPAQAAHLATLLRRAATSRRLQPKYRETAARLHRAAATSAASREPWVWSLTSVAHGGTPR